MQEEEEEEEERRRRDKAGGGAVAEGPEVLLPCEEEEEEEEEHDVQEGDGMEVFSKHAKWRLETNEEVGVLQDVCGCVIMIP